MVEESPITGWQERFPLPESFDNPEFRTWSRSLESSSKDQLAYELIKWGEPLGVDSEVLVQNRSLVGKLDSLIGELVTAESKMVPDEYHGAWSLLIPEERGQLLRLTPPLIAT